jgi:hypothetical protein
MSTNKLNDRELVLLSAAARHPEGAIELASHLKGVAAKKVVGKLMRDGLIEEIAARGVLRSGGVMITRDRWRSPDSNSCSTLRWR